MISRKKKLSSWFAVPLIVSFILSTLSLPIGSRIEANAEFNPPVVRGFNTSAYSDLKRAKDVFGANVFRLQLTPVTEAARGGVSISVGWQRQLGKMEAALQEAVRQGMYVVIDLHEPPLPDPGLKTNSEAFWNNEANLQVLIDSWKEIAQRFEPYRDNIWGYDLLNEPYNPQELPEGAVKWPVWAQKIVDAIRVYDTQTSIIYEASPGALPKGFLENQKWQKQPTFTLIKDPKVIYSFHMYGPHNYTHQGLSTFNKAPVTTDWPDKTVYSGSAENKNWLIKELQPVIDFQNKYHVPIYVGEFSTIRWAPGAAEYIRDLVEIFEQHGWSWSYHAYKEWHGWDVEYNDVMTSDANRESAKATEPTDRELILKAYFNRNVFLPSSDTPAPSVNLIQNGGFETDYNKDGLADYWAKSDQVATSQVKIGESNVQKVTVPQNGGGINQAWFTVSDKNRYLFRAKIRVDSGKVKFMNFNASKQSSHSGTGTLLVIPNTGGEFVTNELEFIPSAGVTRIALWLWSDYASDYMVDDLQLIDLGPVVADTPPATVVSTDDAEPDRLEFRASAGSGRSIVRTEYRIVDQSAEWKEAPADGVHFEPGEYIVGYRSIDSAGMTEWAKSVIFKAANKPVPPNQLPNATDQTVTTMEKQPVNGTLKASDADNDPLQYKLVDSPGKGTVDISSETGAFTYVPRDGETGDDSFTYKVNDGKGDSNSAAISITITKKPPAVTGLTVWGADNLIVQPGKAININVIAVYDDGQKREITNNLSTTYTSSNSSIVRITGQTITAGKIEGKAVVTVGYEGRQTQFNVTVANRTLKSIEPSFKNVTLSPGGNRQATVTATYSDNTTEDVTKAAAWYSSNPNVVSVSKGKITALKKGTCVVIASYGRMIGQITVVVR
ncbi:cellulase family glycosylhydrolase [Paenibacillus sp. sptzw28]|uniref:cellulase family glycosylhydrolase n=1 Tax=Paenibacillus sp. sptzw28 TaxID=715179 RepID=UPI001C6ED5A0|nr:cellulase family glycosylhydrolase [Paenibacillus sp. sptzw28]QYR23759.1 cellulase family glycosylhydrolase [Paenibacillus sp. sptzw28]